MDFVAGIRAWRLWLGLGVQDIRIRYQRTFLGPFWITASQAATFIVMGMLFSAVFKTDVKLYLPYLAAGMVTWNFLGAMAAEGPQIFVDAKHLINALPLPLVVHVLRSTVRNGIVLLHNMSAALGAHLILGGAITSDSLFLLVALPILFASAFGGSLILAICGARFRDLGPAVGVLMQVMFFMTPIMWRPEDIPDASKWWVTINPAYHLLEAVRNPMLGGLPHTSSIIVAAATACVLCLAAWGLFCAFRRRISYWL